MMSTLWRALLFLTVVCALQTEVQQVEIAPERSAAIVFHPRLSSWAVTIEISGRLESAQFVAGSTRRKWSVDRYPNSIACFGNVVNPVSNNLCVLTPDYMSFNASLSGTTGSTNVESTISFSFLAPSESEYTKDEPLTSITATLVSTDSEGLDTALMDPLQHMRHSARLPAVSFSPGEEIRLAEIAEDSHNVTLSWEPALLASGAECLDCQYAVYSKKINFTRWYQPPFASLLELDNGGTRNTSWVNDTRVSFNLEHGYYFVSLMARRPSPISNLTLRAAHNSIRVDISAYDVRVIRNRNVAWTASTVGLGLLVLVIVKFRRRGNQLS